MAKKVGIVKRIPIENRILLVRGQRVMLDRDLAELYGTSTKVLNQAVRRNADRFPPDFMFQLTKAEKSEVVTNCDHLSSLKYSPAQPLAYTEHGAIMAASVLNTPTAVEISVFVVRAFVRLREILSTHQELAKRIKTLEKQVQGHDKAIIAMVDAIKQLMRPPNPPKEPIGFKTKALAPRKTKTTKARKWQMAPGPGPPAPEKQTPPKSLRGGIPQARMRVNLSW